MHVLPVSNLSSCSDAVFKSAFLFFTFDQIMWKLFGSPSMKLVSARCLYWERELYIYFCKFLSVFLTLFPQLSLAKLPRCHFQDCPVSYFLLAERRYSSVLFYISSGPDIFGYERGKRIMKSTVLKCLWLPHNDSLIEHLVLRRVFAL